MIFNTEEREAWEHWATERRLSGVQPSTSMEAFIHGYRLGKEYKVKPQWYEEYIGASITNIRQGNNEHVLTTYAEIRNAEGGLLVAASFDYCINRMHEVSKLISEDE
jgi:hypothetical protein